jgi:hypothetical protein
MRAKQFIEILEEQIRKQLREEVYDELCSKFAQKPVSTQGEIATTWLTLNAQKTVFSRRQAAHQAYQGPRHQHQSALNDRLSRRQNRLDEWLNITTPEGFVALELLHRHSGSPYCEMERVRTSELKSLWRRAALRVHPDRHMNSDQEQQRRMATLFQQLTDAYATILSFCKPPDSSTKNQ